MRAGSTWLGVGIIVALAGAVPAWAQPAVSLSPAQQSAIRASCGADYRAHCASVPPGGGEALACLKQNAPRLSSACQLALGTPSAMPSAPGTAPQVAPPDAPARPALTVQQARLLREYCVTDFRRLCPTTLPGGGAALACLKQNALSLSPPCQQALAAAAPQAAAATP